MDKHAKMTFRVGELYSGWAEEVSTFFSAPFIVDEDGNFTPEQPEQPTAEEKAEHLRDAEAHKRMAEFDAAMVAVAGPDATLPVIVPES